MREPRATPVPAPRSTGAPPVRLPLEAGTVREPERPWRVALLAVLLGLSAAWLDTARRGLWLAAAVVAAMVALHALSVWLRARRRGGDAEAKAWLLMDDREITRVWSPGRAEGSARTCLARWDAPFGLSVLANSSRTRALLAFTTPSATRFLGLRLESPRDADLARELLERATTVADVDLDLATGHAAQVQLGANAARAFLTELDRRDPQALQRLYLSDARGGSVVVEQGRLVIGDRTFDLAAPVEWRVFTFQDGDAGITGASALYQATSVRQGASDAVLVCRAPAELGSWSVGRTPDAPPPRETRVAVDRLFMTPLRAFLEQAPRISRPGAPPTRNRGKTVQT